MNAKGSARVWSAAMRGIEAQPVEVEVDVTDGLPGMSIVGMVDASVLEARERVRCAVKAAGYSWPTGKVLVNLAPTAIKKRGSGYDLAIAVGILAATGQVRRELAEGNVWVGELSLAGKVLAVPGAVCFAKLVESDYHFDRKGLVLSASEGAVHDGEWLADMSGLANLADLRAGAMAPLERHASLHYADALDYADLFCNGTVSRACQVAAAGNHGILLVGPDGVGKRALAARLTTIMPTPDREERMRLAMTLSACGMDTGPAFAGLRPRRMPHHSITGAGMLGGGNPVKPGEASLADGGVLLLDDVNEFSPSILQQLHAPAEEGVVRIARAEGVYEFPARFLLAATSKPCPCGHFGDPDKACTCSPRQVELYQARTAGPLADKLPIRVDVGRQDIIGAPATATSADLRAGVEAAWEYREWRREKGDDDATPRAVFDSCRLGEAEKDMLVSASMALPTGLGGKAQHDVLRIARAIADITESERVSEEHLCEALSYRARF